MTTAERSVIHDDAGGYQPSTELLRNFADMAAVNLGLRFGPAFAALERSKGIWAGRSWNETWSPECRMMPTVRKLTRTTSIQASWYGAVPLEGRPAFS